MAADEWGITITGAEEVAAMLRDAPRNIVAQGFLRALDAGSKPMMSAVALRIPMHTGDMAKALTRDIELDSDGRGGRVLVGFPGFEGFKANFVEYGHRMVGHEPDKKELGIVQPHPFMRPAAAASSDAAIEAFGDSILATVHSEYESGGGTLISGESFGGGAPNIIGAVSGANVI